MTIRGYHGCPQFVEGVHRLVNGMLMNIKDIRYHGKVRIIYFSEMGPEDTPLPPRRVVIYMDGSGEPKTAYLLDIMGDGRLLLVGINRNGTGPHYLKEPNKFFDDDTEAVNYYIGQERF